MGFKFKTYKRIEGAGHCCWEAKYFHTLKANDESEDGLIIDLDKTHMHENYATRSVLILSLLFNDAVTF